MQVLRFIYQVLKKLKSVHPVSYTHLVTYGELINTKLPLSQTKNTNNQSVVFIDSETNK